ncbi:possible citrate synthase, N-terminal [Rhodococcus jostii RHA1]|uniref:Possible citrate synthase, N-terminal n=1 Tax=Rhodococcus jostii (strain RHA1) TaxID=101510 RepID=Q0SGB2_RHOJR|nr:possible citrate synthase, N-terminal [Rhodococcus jostii RHA1]
MHRHRPRHHRHLQGGAGDQFADLPGLRGAGPGSALQLRGGGVSALVRRTPYPAQLELLCQRERAARRVDRSLLPLLAKMPDNCHPMDVVRTAISYSARKTRRGTTIRRPRTSRRRCA